MELGYVITELREQVYYKENCYPFNEFVMDLYTKRKNEKKEFMRLVYKILLNSLYGKFAQKYKGKSQWEPCTISLEELNKLSDFRIKDGYICLKRDSLPPGFCFPIWSSYITAYARCLLYDYIKANDVIYCDTDSIVTRNMIPTSYELGSMKLEKVIVSGIIVKPKFYEFNKKGKVKGIPRLYAEKNFDKILFEEKAKYDRFMTFAQSLNMGIKVNSIVEMEKHFNMEDDKRIWQNKFNKDEFQMSSPVILEHGIDLRKMKKAEEWHNKEMEKAFNQIDFKDFFDSIGDDISKREFFDNEVFFDLR